MAAKLHTITLSAISSIKILLISIAIFIEVFWGVMDKKSSSVWIMVWCRKTEINDESVQWRIYAALGGCVNVYLCANFVLKNDKTWFASGIITWHWNVVGCRNCLRRKTGRSTIRTVWLHLLDVWLDFNIAQGILRLTWQRWEFRVYLFLITLNFDRRLSSTATNALPNFKSIKAFWLMMTSSNGNIFRVTGPLCGEFTGHRWIPLTQASDA